MDADWMKSPTGRRVLVHWADPRPAWLWSGDGSALLWRNAAARFFGGRIKKSGLKVAPLAVPIKGQVARVIRMGSPGRSSLSRIQFLAGDKPVSMTCTCTPIELGAGHMGLLIVGVDAIADELLETGTADDAVPAEIMPPGVGYLHIDDDGHIAAGSDAARELSLEDLPPLASGESAVIEVDGKAVIATRLRANQHDAALLLFEGLEAAPEQAPPPLRQTEPVSEEPLLPMGLPTADEPEDMVAIETDEWVPRSELPQPRSESLTSLFDRLANDAELYAGLEPPGPDLPPAEPHDPIGEIIAYDETPEPVAAPELPAEPEVAAEPEAAGVAPVLYRVTARTIEQVVAEATAEPIPPVAPEIPPPPATPDRDTVERVSRYNFDELSRILTDRVGQEPQQLPIKQPAGTGQPEGQLVNLVGETFILNRLPLGILVFRDQQVLFANRSITEMIGYSSVEELRAAGLAAIFPAAGAQESGPVNHLVRRDGALLPVTARLQSISWQGRPALMLSASATEVRTGHEAAVKAFAELLAETNDDGFIEANRQGVVTATSARALLALGLSEPQVLHKPLSGLIDVGGLRALREFLEKPARFAETARPALTLRGNAPDTELMLFAQGQAGVVGSYFGLVRRNDPKPAPALAANDVEPALLGRLSRGVRRPLNTIIGFADLIRTAAFGAVGNERYAEYARDIKTAGQEIAVLVDELDDFARLRDGRYAPHPAEIDLGGLLANCVQRVRPQAAAARVLVRSAISEKLPAVRVDRASLGQAVLNLLASAVDQSPTGGSVILSAQAGDGGVVTINVRDSGPAEIDPAERFVVFRDGTGRDGEALLPMRSSVGLALTRSLAAVNSCALSIDPAGGTGTLFSLTIPAEAVVTMPAVTAAD